MYKIMTTILAATTLISCGGKLSSSRRDMGTFTADTALTKSELQARRLTPEVMWKMGRIGASVLSHDAQMVAYSLTYYDVAANKPITSLWIMNVDGSDLRQLTDHSGNDNAPQWSIHDDNIFFLSNRSGSSQVWKINIENGAMTQVTGMDHDVSGFGVAPGDHMIWFTAEVKVTNVASSEIFPEFGKSEARIYDDLMVRHWDQWEDGSFSHLFVAQLTPDIITKAKDLTPNEAYDVPTAPYYDNAEITWNAGGDAIAYTCRKKTGLAYSLSTDTDIFLYQLDNERTYNLTVGMEGYDKYPCFSPDGNWIAWQSMERAGNESDKCRLFIINIDNNQKLELTKDFDYNAAAMQWSKDSKSVYFISPIEATHQICSVGIDAGQVRILTEGLHDFNTLNVVNDVIIGQRCDISHADEIFNIDPISGQQTQISFINKRIYDNVDMGRVEKRWTKASDGKQILSWVILPPDFDSTAKYPALLYCQGGPQQTVSQFWSYRWNFQLMAAQGYVVVAPNRRGLPSFGQEWLDQISGDYAGQCQRDLISAIDDVATEPWVNNKKLACVGASFGGFSVFYQAGHHNRRFKAFIAHCGMFDLESFYGATEELWFPNNDLGGPYWDKTNAVAQRSYANSPHKFVDKWDTPILIITGEKDYRIPYTQSLEAFTAARSMGVPARLVSFKDEGHIILKPQNSLVWNREFFDWLKYHVR